MKRNNARSCPMHQYEVFMTPEDEEFNRIEMESRIKQEYVRDMIAKPDIQKIMEELAWARMVIRELGDRLAKLEGK